MSLSYGLCEAGYFSADKKSQSVTTVFEQMGLIEASWVAEKNWECCSVGCLYGEGENLVGDVTEGVVVVNAEKESDSSNEGERDEVSGFLL